jgi:hypothetical protein
MKRTILKEDLLNKALAEMSAAFNLLGDMGGDVVSLASLTKSGASVELDFSDVRKRFSRVGALTSLLLLSHKINIKVNGTVFRKHIQWIDINMDITSKICMKVYADALSTDSELEQAYHLHADFCMALGNLITVINKKKSGDIVVNWIEAVPDLPDWKVPPVINRKIRI